MIWCNLYVAQAYLYKVMLRRTKKDQYLWVKLPPIKIITVECLFSDAEQRLYNAVEQRKGDFMVWGKYVQPITCPFTKLLRLMQGLSVLHSRSSLQCFIYDVSQPALTPICSVRII